jgi:crotonobetainyl-CoA:carnitine CoA-transferase CaiB-like acyl-CoA transferase
VVESIESLEKKTLLNASESTDNPQTCITFDVTKKSALDGVRVIDLSRLLAGNVLSHLLGDFGAEVTKVEPLEGDPLRYWRNEGKSLQWKTYCRNKRSIALNLRKAEAKEALLRMVKRADILIENYRPGTLEKMGLAPSVLHQHNPNLVIVRLTGFGQTGPYAKLPGFGTLVEAMSGYADQNGFSDREPILPPLSFTDKITGIYGAMAASMALLARDRGLAQGQVIDLSLLEPVVSFLGAEVAIYCETGKCNVRRGSASNTSVPRNVYRCRDGSFVALAAPIQAMAERVFRAIGKPEMITDPRFLTNVDRVRNRTLVDDAVGGWFAAKTQDEALAFMREAEVTVAPVYTISDMVQDPNFQQREVLVEVEDKELGSVHMHNITPRLSVTPGVWRRPAPSLGEHTDAILGEVGYDTAAIAQLRSVGAIL